MTLVITGACPKCGTVENVHTELDGWTVGFGQHCQNCGAYLRFQQGADPPVTLIEMPKEKEDTMSEKRVFEGVARDNHPYGWYVRKESKDGIREDKDLGDLLEGLDWKNVRITIEEIP